VLGGRRTFADVEVEVSGARDPVHVVELAPSHAAVPVGREFVMGCLDSWGLEGLADDASLLASEMLSNAVIHARTPIELRVHRLAGGVRIEVRDGAEYGIVTPGHSEGPGVWGLGLRVVATVASRWGIDPVPDGKTVWAEIGGPRPSEEMVRPEIGLGPAPLPLPDDWPEVRLLDVPTRLLLAWEGHMRDLRREFALVLAPEASGAPPADDPVTQVVRTLDRYWELVRPIWAQAVATGELLSDRRISFTLRLPEQAASEGPRFLEALEAAGDLARRGRLLTDPPSEEVTAFGRWLVQTLVLQLGGGGHGAGEDEGAEMRCPFPA
jgi:hypothetical protein